MSSGGSERRRFRRWVRAAHLYAGLALSLLLFVLAVTGGALVYKEAYWRAVYPELGAPPPRLGPAEHAAAIAAIRAEFGDELRSVKLPEPGVSAYHLYLTEGEAFVSTGDHRLIDRWHPRDRVMAFLFDLHAHLLAGDAGERVGGVVGLLGTLLGITGLVLWWPARRRFSTRHLVPRDGARRTLLVWHRDLGALTSPVLFLLLLTGSGLVFYEAARALLNGIFGDPVPAAIAPAAIGAPEPLDADLLRRVERELPGARLVFYYPPTPENPVHGFRLKKPCEMHPNGRSYLYLGPAGEVIERVDACTLPPGERGVHAMYPLHAGKTGGSWYKLVTFLGALALAALSASGVVTYAQKIRRRSPSDPPRVARATRA